MIHDEFEQTDGVNESLSQSFRHVCFIIELISCLNESIESDSVLSHTSHLLLSYEIISTFNFCILYIYLTH